MRESDGEAAAVALGDHVGLERHLAAVLVPDIAAGDERSGFGIAHHVGAIVQRQRREDQRSVGEYDGSRVVIACGQEALLVDHAVEQRAGKRVGTARIVEDGLAIILFAFDGRAADGIAALLTVFFPRFAAENGFLPRREQRGIAARETCQRTAVSDEHAAALHIPRHRAAHGGGEAGTVGRDQHVEIAQVCARHAAGADRRDGQAEALLDHEAGGTGGKRRNAVVPQHRDARLAQQHETVRAEIGAAIDPAIGKRDGLRADCARQRGEGGEVAVIVGAGEDHAAARIGPPVASEGGIGRAAAHPCGKRASD